MRRLDKLLPNRAPILLPHYKEQVGRLRPTLKTEVKSLSETSRRERVEALAAINSICVEAVDISFNGLALGEEAPKYDARSPFRGLESFRPEDSEFFFGREALTRKLVVQIQAHSFLAVLGASGSGKSSLVMAGVIPALDSDYVIFRPGTNPLDELESARGNSLIVVDQFEELFTLTRDESTRVDFIARLLDEATRTRMILTLRSDFLGEVGAYRTLSAEIQNHLEIIPPMDLGELRRAMEGQASVVGLRFEADLSQQILDDVAGEPGAMPLLQHALWELWNRRHGRNLRASEYRAFGGVRQAITSTAEKVYADCSKPEQDALRDIFLRLTRLDDGDEGRDTRRRVSLGDLIPSGRDASSITLLLDKLANARLIVKTINEDNTEVEVAHEALIRHWERLRLWLNEDREGLLLHDHLNNSAHQWESRGRDVGELYRGARLKQAEKWMEEHNKLPSPLEGEFVKASIVELKRGRRSTILRRTVVAGAGILVLLTIVLAMAGKLNRLIFQPVGMENYWIAIPAGEFQMGSSDKELVGVLKTCPDCNFSDEQPQNLVYLDNFQIGKYEVTNRQYTQCVRAGACDVTLNPGDDMALHPVVLVNWYDAEAYCEWVGGHLPTEAEWEKAASWDEDHQAKRIYPWGDRMDCSFASYAGCVNATMPVGSYENGKSHYEIYDMAGNVSEWTNSAYHSYPYDANDGREDSGFLVRVLRGGSWRNSGYDVRTTLRVQWSSRDAGDSIGFRCARDVP